MVYADTKGTKSLTNGDETSDWVDSDTDYLSDGAKRAKMAELVERQLLERSRPVGLVELHLGLVAEERHAGLIQAMIIGGVNKAHIILVDVDKMLWMVSGRMQLLRKSRCGSRARMAFGHHLRVLARTTYKVGSRQSASASASAPYRVLSNE